MGSSSPSTVADPPSPSALLASPTVGASEALDAVDAGGEAAALSTSSAAAAAAGGGERAGDGEPRGVRNMKRFHSSHHLATSPMSSSHLLGIEIKRFLQTCN